MTLAAGARLGPYEVLAPLGAGGLGAGWEARALRHERLVAVKILPRQLAADPDFLARFERESKAVAALSHPNILAIHDIGTHDEVAYAVMELLEGESLRTRLGQGPLPARKAVELAIQMARGLACAHDKGVVHRDLKPDNLWLTKDGRLKILDFGLAKQVALPDPAMRSELLTEGVVSAAAPATEKGAVLGTVGYMSPEQVRGESVDARSDLFSFGAVLFEMVVGQRAFARCSSSETLAAILRDDPPELATTAGRPLPPGLERIIHHCLEKSPEQRFRSAHDVAFALDSVASGSAPAVPFTAPFAPENRRTTWKWAGLVAVLVAAAGVGSWVVGRRADAGPGRSGAGGLAHLAIALPDGDRFADTNRQPLALSPDGTLLAYVGLRDGLSQLFLRRLAEREPVVLAGTEGGAVPFFSPDGQWIAFFADGLLKKVAVGGAGLQVIWRGTWDPRGGCWGADGTIYFAPTNSSGLWAVPAAGGTATEVTRVDRARGEVSHRWPQALDDGRSLLFTIWTGPGLDESEIVVQSLADGERHVLVPGGHSPRYVSSGHLLYARLDTLFAVPWRPPQADFGGAAPTALAVHPRLENEGAAAYAVADNGTLVYLAGGASRYAQRLVWVDRAGRVEALPVPERDYESVAISPDGRQAVVQIKEGSVGLWLCDLARHTLTPFVTDGGSSQAPVWTPDGRRVVYRATRSGSRNLFWKAADGTDAEERLTTRDGVTQTPTSFSPDGTVLAFNENGGPGEGVSRIWTLPLTGDGAPHELLQTPVREMNGQVSPDGAWLAMSSFSSGQSEVHVRPFPGPGASRQLSIGGGSEPRWSRDGRELFYRNRHQLVAVAVPARPELEWGEPQLLFEGAFKEAGNGNTAYDVAADGKRFLRVQQVQPDRPLDHLEVVLNWGDELRRLVPAR